MRYITSAFGAGNKMLPNFKVMRLRELIILYAPVIILIRHLSIGITTVTVIKLII